LNILKKISAAAEITEKDLKAMFDWVSEGWEWYAKGIKLANLSARDNTSSE